MLSDSQRRSKENRSGDIKNAETAKANNLAYLLAPLFKLAWSRGVIVFMEQPSNSWLPRFPPVLHALADCNCEKIVTFLGSFSEELGIPKPIQLWSNAVYCRHLYRRKVEKDPTRRSFYYTQSFDEYTGAAGLKSSGAYPYEFGEAVVKYHMQYNNAQELPTHQAWLVTKIVSILPLSLFCHPMQSSLSPRGSKKAWSPMMMMRELPPMFICKLIEF